MTVFPLATGTGAAKTFFRMHLQPFQRRRNELEQVKELLEQELRVAMASSPEPRG
jgi:hypothetical protein